MATDLTKMVNEIAKDLKQGKTGRSLGSLHRVLLAMAKQIEANVLNRKR